MSIAVSSALPSGILSASRVARRVTTISTMHLAGLVLVVLVGGILASVVTTTDPLWWHLHFSQLGTFHDVSGALFNTSLKAAGLLVVVFAVRVRRDLVRLGRSASRRGAATIAQACLTTIGVNLALVGCVPLNTNKDLHDKVAGMMVLGFAALLLTSPVLLHRMPRRLPITTAIVFVVLFAGAWLFVTETINLALFEVIAFGVMFAWSGVFTHCLAVRAGSSAASGSPDATTRRAARPADAPRASARCLRRATGVFASPVAAAARVASTLTAAPYDASAPTASPVSAAPLAAATVPAPAGVTTTHRLTVAGPAAARARTIAPARAGTLSADAARVAWAGRPRPARIPSTSRQRPPRGPQPTTAAARAARVRPRRGCTASAARAASGKSTTPVRR